MRIHRFWTNAVRVVATLFALLAVQAVLAAPGSPQFTSPASTTFTVGVFNTFTVTVSGTPTPTIFLHGKNHRLPGGLTFKDNHDGTGTLSGTPRSGGNATITFHASNGVSPSASQNFVLHMNQAPAFTSANITTCAVGVSCSFTVRASGVPAPTITRTGPTLPAGMNYVDNHNGTGTLSGTPAGGTQGSYPFTFTAANGVGSDAVQNFTLVVNRFLVFTSANSATCTVGTLCTISITANGQPLPTMTHSGGALPAGMTFVANGAGSATLSGTPQAGAGGLYFPIFTASNGVEPDAVQSFNLTVNEAPAFTSATSSFCAVGSSCTFTVVTRGYPVPTVANTSGSFPSGVTYLDNGDGTGTFDGTPNAGSIGVYHPVFTASNGIGTAAIQNFTLTVNLSLAITSDDSVDCVVGTACTFTVTTNGVPVPTLTQTGATLPTQITFVDNHDGTATLSGTGDVGKGGVYNLIITAANGIETNVVQNFTLTLNEAPAIVSANNTACVVGIACTFTVTSLGYPEAAIERTAGTLPGLVDYIDNLDGTGTLSGTASVGTGGQYLLSFTASNGIGADSVQSFTLTINEAPAITSAPPPAGTTSAPYTFTYVALGYPAPTFTVSAGALPPPLSLSTAGVISGGTPTTVGLYTGTVTASNGIGTDATQDFSINITNASTVPTAPQGVSALSGNAQATVSFAPPVSDGGALITGYVVTCTPAAGTPVTAAGGASPINVPGLTNGVTYTCTVHATNSNGDGPESAASNPVTPSAAAPAALNVVVNGSGTGSVASLPSGIACPGDCTEVYPAGTGVVLTATATGGSVFTGWLGGGCGLAATCTVTINAATSVSATFAAPGTTGTLDVDASAPSSTYDALTDGLLVMRYLFGLTGAPLINNAVGPTAQRTTAAQIETYLADILPRLDADGNGTADALTDGLLILRFQFGITGPALISGAIGPGATRTTAAAIESYLSSLQP